MWSAEEMVSRIAFEMASRTTFLTEMRSWETSLSSMPELTSEQSATRTDMAQFARLIAFLVSALTGGACSASVVQHRRSWMINWSIAVRGLPAVSRLSFPPRRRPIVRNLGVETT